MTKNVCVWTNYSCDLKKKIYQKLQFTYQKRPSNTSKHELLQILGILLWVIFAFLYPDSESRSGSTDPIEYGSNPNPDQQPCTIVLFVASICNYIMKHNKLFCFFRSTVFVARHFCFAPARNSESQAMVQTKIFSFETSENLFLSRWIKIIIFLALSLHALHVV
jgi:hypothetical protein